MGTKIMPLLTEEEFKKLIENRKIFRIPLRSLNGSEKIQKFISYFKETYLFHSLNYLAHKKESMSKDIKGIVEGDCAGDTDIENFPLDKFIECEMGDPVIIDLKLIGRYDLYYVFKTKSNNFILSRMYEGKASYLAPTKNN